MRSSRLTVEMLEGVVALVRHKTFERASKDLDITPSALHKRIDRLNEIFGVQLFVSTREGMVPIAEAQTLVQDSLRIIEYTLLAEQRTMAVVSSVSGRVRIGHSTHIPPKLLAILNRIIADATLGLRVEDRGELTISLKQQVLEGALDAGIGFLPIPHPDLTAHVLVEDPVVVCMSQSHRLAQRSQIEPTDLDGEPIVAVSRIPHPALHKEIDDFFQSFGVSLNVRQDAFGPPEALTMVEQQQGVCMVGASAVGSHRVSAKPLSPRVLLRKSAIFLREDNSNADTLRFVELLLEKASRRRSRS